MAGDHHDPAYHKDLSHTTWDEVFARQQKRAPLAQDYWDLARGRPGFRIADVGCGPGFFTLLFADMTGPTGHVHAVDASPEALAFLRTKLDPVHHAHVTTEVLDLTRAPLPDLHFHALVCTDMLHHAEDVPAVLANLRQAKAPLVIAEFDPAGPGDMGPPITERLAPDALTALLSEAGWRPGPWRALRHEHYAIVAQPG